MPCFVWRFFSTCLVQLDSIIHYCNGVLNAVLWWFTILIYVSAWCGNIYDVVFIGLREYMNTDKTARCAYTGEKKKRFTITVYLFANLFCITKVPCLRHNIALEKISIDTVLKSTRTHTFIINVWYCHSHTQCDPGFIHIVCASLFFLYIDNMYHITITS